MSLIDDCNEWLAEVMARRPVNNTYLDSPRGIEVAKLMLGYDKSCPPWRRGDPDTFWVDVQLLTKYGLSDQEVMFVCKMQPGVEQYQKHSKEHRLVNSFMKTLKQLEELNQKEEE